MDPITLILEALEHGNAPDVGMQTMIPDDIRNEYGDFTELVAARLESAGGHDLLDRYMGAPDVYGDTLANALVEAGAANDDELIAAAQTFMEMVDLRGARRGRFTVEFGDEDGAR